MFHLISFIPHFIVHFYFISFSPQSIPLISSTIVHLIPIYFIWLHSYYLREIYFLVDIFSRVKFFLISRGHIFLDDSNFNFSLGYIFVDACKYRQKFFSGRTILSSKHSHKTKHDDQIFSSKLQQMK